jgi:STE24 endopeptidase
VYEIDASRQTARMSANVSERQYHANYAQRQSFAPQLTGRIQAVMGHEMGIYVLNHNYKGIHVLFDRRGGVLRQE